MIIDIKMVTSILKDSFYLFIEASKFKENKYINEEWRKLFNNIFEFSNKYKLELSDEISFIIFKYIYNSYNNDYYQEKDTENTIKSDFHEVHEFLKKYNDVKEDKEYWYNMVNEMGDLSKKHKSFIFTKLICVIINYLEDKYYEVFEIKNKKCI